MNLDGFMYYIITDLFHFGFLLVVAFVFVFPFLNGAFFLFKTPILFLKNSKSIAKICLLLLLLHTGGGGTDGKGFSLTNKEGLVREVNVGGSLGCSD